MSFWASTSWIHHLHQLCSQHWRISMPYQHWTMKVFLLAWAAKWLIFQWNHHLQKCSLPQWISDARRRSYLLSPCFLSRLCFIDQRRSRLKQIQRKPNSISLRATTLLCLQYIMGGKQQASQIPGVTKILSRLGACAGLKTWENNYLVSWIGMFLVHSPDPILISHQL